MREVIEFRNVFTSERVEPARDGDVMSLSAASLFKSFPLALLLPTEH
jgi:hypothetical protein